MKNFLRVIKPYKKDGVWAFDDDDFGLVREPFVFGADDMLESVASRLDLGTDGFLLYFSDRPFPGAHIEMTWIREEAEGNWYRMESTSMEGWLCPAMYHYFEEAPKKIFIKAERPQKDGSNK